MKLTRSIVVRFIYWNVLALCIALGLVVTLRLNRTHRYERLIVRACRKYDVDPRLITAVIWTESRFKADAVGKAGELGLMQVMEPAGREWAQAVNYKDFSREMLADPRINIEAGCWYLGRAIAFWAQHDPDPYPYALAEYNAGRSRVQAWRSPAHTSSRQFVESIPFPTTKKYVQDILERYRGGI